MQACPEVSQALCTGVVLTNFVLPISFVQYNIENCDDLCNIHANQSRVKTFKTASLLSGSSRCLNRADI